MVEQLLQVQVVSQHVLRGPNVWHYRPVVHLVVDLGELEQRPTNLLPGFADQLLALLPGLSLHTCSEGEEGGLVARMRRGTWLGHVTEHVALELQKLAGHDVRRGKTRGVKGHPGRYNVIVAYLDETVGAAACELAVRLVNDVLAGRGESIPSAIEAFLIDANRRAFGPSTQALLDEARARRIPWMRLNRYSLIQLGQGVHQRRLRATITSLTSEIAVDIAQDKELTLSLLRSAGLPVPRSVRVESQDEAARVANRLGYPIVVKPSDGNHGRGVALELMDEESVRSAYDRAQPESRDGSVQVETFVRGSDFRFLVVGGKVVAVAERVPAHVIGDGAATVTELVDAVNADPRRGIGHERELTRIRLDAQAAECLAAQGFSAESVPGPGVRVLLTRTGNISTGGTAIDRTHEVHPENIEIAEEAAGVIGLDIAGIDILATDIALPLRETGGGICEVNAAPGFRMHTHPTEGEPQFVAKAVLDLLFPDGAPSRIPIVAVTGTNGKTTTCRMIAHIFKGIGRTVGMTSTDGVVIDERLLIQADASGPRSARMVLQNPRIDMAVLEVARGGIIREGLGHDRNDVGVVLNVQEDHLGMHGVDTLEELATIKRVVVEAVPREGWAVLNADDPLVRGMRTHCDGRVLYFTMEPVGSEIRDRIDRHCRRGGYAVVLESSDLGEMIVVKEGTRDMRLAWTHLLPATFQGRARMNVQNALAATAAAYAAGASLHDIRMGLRTFSTSYYLSPGRLNELTVQGRTVIVDYCHNPPAMRHLGQFVDATAEHMAESNPGMRRIGVVATAGDRRDADVEEFGRIAAHHFDVLIMREDERKRGRAPGDLAQMTARAAATVGARCRDVRVELDETGAVREALDASRPGDLVVLCVDRHREVMAELERYSRRAAAGSAPVPTDVVESSVADPDLGGSRDPL